jgi:hypothetical protein
MAKVAYKKLINRFIILVLIILVVAFLFRVFRSTSYEGLESGDTNEVRAVSHLHAVGSATPYSATADQLTSTLQAYGPKMIADGINASADQINAVLQNVDSAKFASLYNTLLTKINPPYPPSSSVGITSNANIANAFLNTLSAMGSGSGSSGSAGGGVVAAGPATTINASAVAGGVAGPVAGPASVN